MEDLLNKQVKHISWGIGDVIEQTNTYINVRFDIGDKKFQYPDAFEKFLICLDTELQNMIAKELYIKKQKEENERKTALMMKQLEESLKSKTDNRSHVKKTYPKANIAFKCNFCDGGSEENGIGFVKACSDSIINYNIETAHHSWCCNEDSPCHKYYIGDISRKELDSYLKNGEFVCYESQMLSNWTAFAGFNLSGENKYKPMKLKKVKTPPESERFVFGVFLVDEAYEGDNRDEGYVTTTSKYKLCLSREQATKILFWNYYRNENAPDKIVWGQGLHRYVSDVQAACILKDIADIKKGTNEENLANEFLEHFCKINKLDIDKDLICNGALNLYVK